MILNSFMGQLTVFDIFIVEYRTCRHQFSKKSTYKERFM